MSPLRLRLLAITATALACSLGAAAPAGIAVLPPASWSPGDHVRSGAADFEVLLHVARLKHEHGTAGLVSVGDHNGSRLGGGELALRHAALTGVPVAKIAPDGRVAADPDALFLDCGALDADRAARVLARCLELHGAPPAVTDPENPTARELAAIRAHLRKFQAALVREGGRLVAVR